APEIYQAGAGKQYMIPGDNGKVISNKDMQGGSGGGTSLNQVMNITVNTTNGLDDATIKQLRQAWKTDTMLILKDQQRPRGLLSR
ncbi:phage tail protein, partial [Yersinia kristensenii]|nr:phage tail protein [Yersinia kristensenii]